MGAVHALDGGLGGEAVDGAMQVHHQQMDAVAGLATGGAERGDLPVSDAVALESGQGRELGLQPRLELGGLGASGHGDGRGHGAQVLGEAGCQKRRSGRKETLRIDSARARRQRVESRRIQPDGAPLGVERQRRTAGIGGPARGLLQQSEADLQAVVGFERRGDQGGQQDGAFAQRFNDFDLADHGSLRLCCVIAPPA